MGNNFKASLEHVLKYEGSYVDHPKDPGGATMKGVTLAVFRKFYGNTMSKNDLKNITETQLECIYKKGYWDVCKCDDLPIGVDFAVFDAAVNSGPGRSIKWLQQAVDTIVDGNIGPATIKAANSSVVHEVIFRMCSYRLGFIQGLSTWDAFGKGWSKRVFEVLYTALITKEQDE